MRNAVLLVVLTIIAIGFVAALPACDFLGLGGGGPDAGTDAGPALNGGKLTACSCDPLEQVNNTKPICGCTPGSVGTGPALRGAAFTSAVVDGTGDRLIVGIAGVGGANPGLGGALWGVDLKTGNRTTLSGAVDHGTAVGSGDDMVDVNDVDVGTNGTFVAYESSASASGIVNQVQSIDAASGNRTTIVDASQFTTPLDCTTTATIPVTLSNINPASGFAVGSDGTIYFGVHLESNYAAVVAVSPGATPTCKVLSGDDGSDTTDEVGSGDLMQDVSSLTFGDGSLWVYDFVTSALFKIDPSSGTRTIASEPSAVAPVGNDADPGNTCFPNDVTTNPIAIGNGIAFGPGGGAQVVLTKVNLSNGDRSCIGGTPTGAANQPVIDFQNIDSSGGVYIAPNGVVITVGADTIWEIDTDASIANVLSE